MLKIFRILLTVLLSLVTWLLAAQDFTFTAKASKSSLGLNERVKVEYTVNKSGTSDFQAPAFEGFKIIAGPSTSVNRRWINGKSSFSLSYIYFLQPTAQGNVTIPPASIKYKDKTVNTNALELTITEGVATKDPVNKTDQATKNNNIFLVAHISNTQPFLGESIYVEYRLYFSNKIEFSDAQFGENPKYEGFWNQDINISSYDRKTGKYKGTNYNYYVLKKAVLIPQKTGKLIVEPLSMDILVGRPTGRYDFFGYEYMNTSREHFSSGNRYVTVKPLPAEGKPAGFSGAVGDYNLNVSANKNTINTSEATRIDVEVTGMGNMKLFNIPKLSIPSNLEVYPPERKESLSTTVRGLKGKITDTYNVVAPYNGKYIIPRVKFSYFNPKDEKYHTVFSNEIVVNVEGESQPLTTTDQTPKQQVVQSAENFRYIKTNTSLNPMPNGDFYGSKWFYGLLTLPFLAIPLFILAGNKRKKRKADVQGNKLREANRLSKKYLSEAKQQLGHKEAFYTALERALHNFLKAKLHLETNDMSQDNIAALLQEKGVNQTTIMKFSQALNDCNYARYTPMSRGNMEDALNHVAGVLQEINAELK